MTDLLIALAIGTTVGAGVFLVLRDRSLSVIFGLTLLTYAVNFFVFVMGRLSVAAAPRIREGIAAYADPLSQALVLTAIVISFAMTAFIVVLAIRANRTLGDDHVDAREPEGEARE